MKVRKIPSEEYKSIYSRVPRFCVDLIIKKHDGILLTKRNIEPKKGWWHFPGGTVLMGETLKNAINRIAHEELAAKVEIKKMIGYIEYKKGSGFGYPISVLFLVVPLSSKLEVGKQTKEIGYFISPPPKTIIEVKKFIKGLYET